MTSCIKWTWRVEFFVFSPSLCLELLILFSSRYRATFIPELHKVHRLQPEANADVGVSRSALNHWWSESKMTWKFLQSVGLPHLYPGLPGLKVHSSLTPASTSPELVVLDLPRRHRASHQKCPMVGVRAPHAPGSTQMNMLLIEGDPCLPSCQPPTRFFFYT